MFNLNFFRSFSHSKITGLNMSVNKLETLEVSGTPEDIGFAIGQADADSIQKQVLQLAEFRETEWTWQSSSYLQELLTAVRYVFPEYVLKLEGMANGEQV